MDEIVPRGANYDKAEFRLWYPDNAKSFRAILVLIPGANAADGLMWETNLGRPLPAATTWRSLVVALPTSRTMSP